MRAVEWPSYSTAELLALLALSRSEAIEQSSGLGSPMGRLSADGKPSGSSGDDEPPLSLFARWVEVHAAARRVVERAEQAYAVRAGEDAVEVLALRGQGLTLREISERITVSRSSVQRGSTDLLAAIVDELGGEPVGDALSQVPACMRCAQRPRTRLPEVVRQQKGGHRVVQPARLSSFCSECKAHVDAAAAAAKKKRRRPRR